MSGEFRAARAAALAPPRAFGAPLAAGVVRLKPEDFLVEEDLGFAPSGSGQHVLLKVAKREANTMWVARELARALGCRSFEVGFAGLKDRHSLAVQWFSVPRPRDGRELLALRGEGFEVLEAHAHARKLPRGALAANAFVIRVRAAGGDGPGLAAQLAPRLAEISRRGVPNYFGAQRFGRDGANLRAAAGLAALKGAERGFVLSAARSALFNAALAARVAAGSWDELTVGDLAILDGRGSIFAVSAMDDALTARCRALEIHPSGPLWGSGEPPSAAAVKALELCAAAPLAAETALCTAAGMRHERRSLRLAVRELSCQAEADAVLLRFRLARGGFATAVLRELIEELPGGTARDSAPAGEGAGLEE